MEVISVVKNIQVIDGAENCTYDVYSVEDNIFEMIFPEEQDIEFSSDLTKRLGFDETNKVLNILWQGICEKKEVLGIHGTLFFELEFKKAFYPSKKEKEMIVLL